MQRKTTLTIAIAALCLLGAVTIGGVSAVTAADAANNTTVEQTEPTGEAGYTVSELRKGGTTYSNSPDSFRLAGDQMYWMIHWPADTAFGSPGDLDDQNWEYLPEDGVVDRNTIYLRTINMEQSESVTVNIVAYETEETENGTVPVNVHERTTEAELDAGWSMAAIDLPQSDSQREVAVWIDGHEEDLRWHFGHKSVATTQAQPISTMGEYLRHAAADFLIPLVIGVFGAGAVGREAISRAGIGPQWGYTKWIMLIGVGAFVTAFFAFSSVAEVVVAAPRLVALGIVVLFAIVLIESYSTGVTNAEFLRPELQDATSPTGDEAYDVASFDRQEEQIIRTDDGSTAVVRPGLLPFLSRCFGGAARLENAAAIETKIHVNESTIDSLYFVSAQADDILEYEPEGWQLDMPDIDIKEQYGTLSLYGVAALAALGVVYSLAGITITLLAALGMIASVGVRPRNGYARIEPASIHERRVYASMMYLELETEDAQTISEYEKKIPELKAKAKKERAEAMRDQDATLVEKMMGEEGMERTLSEIMDGTPENGTEPEPSEPEEKEAKTP